jgi:hypothetical protein
MRAVVRTGRERVPAEFRTCACRRRVSVIAVRAGSTFVTSKQKFCREYGA